MVRASKVPRSGQITLPRPVRAALGTDRVRIILENGQVRIEPSDPGGSLQRYAGKPRIPFKQERDQAWEAVIRDKASRYGKPVDI
jgi:bifunctional DNA-binding transcriptional regulator/antitoxin component of YhaV-PrlF toxin-antitoxin module